MLFFQAVTPWQITSGNRVTNTLKIATVSVAAVLKKACGLKFFFFFVVVVCFFFFLLCIVLCILKASLSFFPLCVCVCVFQWLYNMQDTDARGSSPAFLRPQNGSSHRSSGYVPGRIAPLRPPPPAQSHAAAEFTSARQEARTRLPSLPVDQHRRQAEANRHKNTLICFAISSLSLFVALGIFLGIASKYAPDGKFPCKQSHPWSYGPCEHNSVIQHQD